MNLGGSENIKPAEVSFNNMNNIDAAVIGSIVFDQMVLRIIKPLNLSKGSTGVYVITVDKVNNASSNNSSFTRLKKDELNRILVCSLY